MTDDVPRQSGSTQDEPKRQGRDRRFVSLGAPPRVFGRTWTAITWRYGVAVVAVVLATLVRAWLGRSYGLTAPFVVHYPAVLLVAIIAGTGPGILATMLSALSTDYWFLSPVGLGIGTAGDAIAMGIFVGLSLSLCALAEQVRRARWAKAVSAAQAEELALVNLGNLLVLDPDGRIVRWSDGCQHLYGFDRREAEGRLAHQLLQVRSSVPREQARRTLLQQGRWEGELIHHRKDGAEVMVASVWVLRRDDDGRPLAILEVLNDITDRKRTEALLQTANLELARKTAEIEQLLYTVSHDLKSPLVTIQGFLGHVHSDMKTGRLDRMLDYSQRIQNAANRMARLIDDLLTFSRIGRVTHEPVSIDLSELVNEVVRSHAQELAAARITVSVQENMPILTGDQDRLHQVFDNLLVNAIKYGSDAAEPRIGIGSRQQDNALCVFVRDNGKGISPEFHKKVFELFSCLEHDKGGSGVGLAIVKKVVEAHGGHVWVESCQGDGTRFWMSFPVKREHHDDDLPPTEPHQ